MKISSDYIANLSGFNNAKTIKTSTNFQGKSPIKEKRQHSQKDRRQIRELSSAMMMIQKARHIIQQALTVSSQINNLATATLQTGEINATQLTQELAQVNAFLDEFGMDVTAPVLPLKKLNLGFKNDFFEIKQAAMMIEKQIKTKNVDFDKIDESVGLLKKKDDEFKIRLDLIFSQFDDMHNEKNKKSANIIKTIHLQPGKALFAQGNINTKSVYSVLV